MPARVFVSYKHEDENWRIELMSRLGSGIYREKFDLWSDIKLEPGQHWNAKINEAITSSRIVILLVSNKFLESDFIVNDELRKILKRRKAGGAKVFWIAIENIPGNLLGAAGLDMIQALWPKPLSDLKPEERDDAWMRMGSWLIDAIDHEQWDDLRQKVDEALADSNVILDKVIAEGDYSVFYRARQGDRNVAIKALVPAPGREWLNRDFVARAKLVSEISNSTAINIRSVVDDGPVPCVIADFVDAETLAKRLKDGLELSPRTIADIISQLVRVAGHLYKLDGQPIVGPVRPSHVHYDIKKSKAFISLIPISSETLASCRSQPTKFLSSDTLPYLSPESFFGEPINERTDQYHFGLLAVELLDRKPPFTIRSFGDLEKNAELYRSPRKYLSEEFRRREPALAFILARMLERYPDDRWEEPQRLIKALQEVSEGSVPEVIKQKVDTEYSNLLKGNFEFFSSFYQILFDLDKSNEIRGIFKNVGMSEQHQKLAAATASIVDFTHDTFRQHVGRHRRLVDDGLKPEHFKIFGEAFLEALRSVQGTDEYSQDAWRAVLNAALTYMSGQIFPVMTDARGLSPPTASA
jgi:hemoglobin-like flavoprotein